MKIDGHYDDEADIAWLRFEGYDPASVVAEETTFGLRELDASGRHVVGLEYWHASKTLPADLLRMLGPPVELAAAARIARYSSHELESRRHRGVRRRGGASRAA
jgi:uncharacterized protein YuzE